MCGNGVAWSDSHVEDSHRIVFENYSVVFRGRTQGKVPSKQVLFRDRIPSEGTDKQHGGYSDERCHVCGLLGGTKPSNGPAPTRPATALTGPDLATQVCRQTAAKVNWSELLKLRCNVLSCGVAHSRMRLTGSTRLDGNSEAFLSSVYNEQPHGDEWDNDVVEENWPCVSR